MIALDSKGDTSLLLTEENIAKVTIDSGYVRLKIKNNLSLSIDSSTQVLLFFSYDCYCSIAVTLLHDTSCCRFQKPNIYYNDANSIIENGEIRIVHGHLRISEEERERLLRIFKGFVQE